MSLSAPPRAVTAVCLLFGCYLAVVWLCGCRSCACAVPRAVWLAQVIIVAANCTFVFYYLYSLVGLLRSKLYKMQLDESPDEEPRGICAYLVYRCCSACSGGIAPEAESASKLGEMEDGVGQRGHITAASGLEAGLATRPGSSATDQGLEEIDIEMNQAST